MLVLKNVKNSSLNWCVKSAWLNLDQTVNKFVFTSPERFVMKTTVDDMTQAQPQLVSYMLVLPQVILHNDIS